MMTINDLKEKFNDYISQQNPKINPSVIGTDWDIYSTAIGGIGASIYQDIEGLRQAIFIQYASGVYLDWSAFSLGLPPRQGASIAMVFAATTPPYPSLPDFFPAGTVFTSTFNSDPYTLVSDVTVSTSDASNFSLQASQSGPGYQLPVGSTLTNTVFPDVVITVNNSTDGQLFENDGQLRKRILQARQNPTGAGRTSDYINWAIIGSAYISDGITKYGVQFALVIKNIFANSSAVGVFTLSGTFNYDQVVLNSSPYSLTTSDIYLQKATTYINTQRPAQANIFINTVETYMIPNDITINVVLPLGVTLASTVTNFNGDSISVEDIIFQEFRRGIVSYQLGGSVLDNEAFLFLSQIGQSLDVGLSINGGIYAQILISWAILVDAITQNISVPLNFVNPSTDRLQCVYDILQSNVTINQVT